VDAAAPQQPQLGRPRLRRQSPALQLGEDERVDGVDAPRLVLDRGDGGAARRLEERRAGRRVVLRLLRGGEDAERSDQHNQERQRKAVGQRNRFLCAVGRGGGGRG